MDSHAEHNRKHFDATAHSYDSEPWAQKLSAQLTNDIIQHLDWIGLNWVDPDHEHEISQHELRVLDYACGPGMVSRAFAPYTTSVIGMDISSGMVDVYNERASNQGLAPSEMKAIQGDLFATPESKEIDKPELWDFDLAAVGLAFHHFDDEVLAAKRLVERVKRGTGKVLIIDFLPHKHIGGHGHGHDHGHHHGGNGHVHEAKGNNEISVEMPKDVITRSAHTVKHMGFSEERMKEIFESAGCTDVKVEVLGTGISMGVDGTQLKRTVFLCVATRKA